MNYLTSDHYGVNLVGPEGDEQHTAQVWHEEALIEELGLRAWGLVVDTCYLEEGT